MQPSATARATKRAAEKLAATRRLRWDLNAGSEVVTGNPIVDELSGEPRGSNTKKTLYAQMDAMLTAFQDGKFTDASEEAAPVDAPKEAGPVATRSPKRREQLLSRPVHSSADAGGIEDGRVSDWGNSDCDDDGSNCVQDSRELPRCVC